MEQITLRQAREEDLQFLFDVSTRAMSPVTQALQGEEKTLEEYKEKFEPEKIQVIQYGGKDVGRLRVVRSPENIYIGGIQILPEFQGKGIGTKLMEELKKEAEESGLPILLEVHEVNGPARAFYAQLGFKPAEVVGKKIALKYVPQNGPK